MNNKLQYCYHTHTSRCGHAFGNDEEYVKSAIKFGIKRLGFSDHIIFPKGYEQPTIRGSYDVLDDYLLSIKSLKEKYKSQIEILVGFEAEYFPDMIGYYKELLDKKVDYLILGQHCRMVNSQYTWYFDGHCFKIEEYVNDVIEGMRTGLFTYFAHPDFFMRCFSEWNKDIEMYSRRILEVCEELDIPIEINICGMRRDDYKEDGLAYPHYHFFQLAKEYKVRTIIGIDAHAPEHFNQVDVDKCFEFIKKYDLKIIDDYKI